MDESKLEDLLNSIYTNEIQPSPVLVSQTKVKLKARKGMVFLVACAVVLNSFILTAAAGCLLLTDYSWIIKVLAYIVFSSTVNLIIAAVYANRSKFDNFVSNAV